MIEYRDTINRVNYAVTKGRIEDMDKLTLKSSGEYYAYICTAEAEAKAIEEAAKKR